MNPTEKFYLISRKNELILQRETMKAHQNKISSKQQIQTNSALNARISEIEKFINFSRNIGSDISSDGIVLNQMLLDENISLKAELKRLRTKN
jgi:hypothetical protein